jgi:hypothetical protein
VEVVPLQEVEVVPLQEVEVVPLQEVDVVPRQEVEVVLLQEEVQQGVERLVRLRSSGDRGVGGDPGGGV